MTPRPASLDRLVTALAEPGGGESVVRGRPARDGRKAAVLICFSGEAGAAPGDLQLIIIEKSARLRSHAGQCAFPGGGVDPADASSVAAAFREANEEVGLHADTVDLLVYEQQPYARWGEQRLVNRQGHLFSVAGAEGL